MWTSEDILLGLVLMAAWAAAVGAAAALLLALLSFFIGKRLAPRCDR